ncbi:hypothetical protein RBSWK_06277 [Rhodopirellula baltica SWK14]|uniref:Uncharacterized protein n=2 Tax=Rhodopirellula baltica TaxID=265606 RepID=L7C6D4_RHOBT|nr:hypothetical protein RBSWK_06277 [Rhodopirellula baltica SWK14]
MTLKKNQLSIRRTAVAFGVLAIAFAYYRNLPFAGMTIGFLVGVPSFFIVLLVRKDQLRGIVRCYVYAALCVVLAAGMSPLDVAAWGGVVGWTLAVIQNQFIRARNADASGLPAHVDTSDYGR